MTEDEPPAKKSHGVRNGIIITLVVLLVAGAGAIVYLVKNGTLDWNLPFIGGPSTTAATTPTNAPTDTTTVVPDGVKTRSFQLVVGDCFTYATLVTTNNQYTWVVDCSQPHDTEVFATAPITDTSYPPTDGPAPSWTNWGATVCDPAFKPYVGVDWSVSTLRIFKLYPDEVTWDNEPDMRTIVCMARDVSGIPLTTSVANSDR